MSKAESLPIDKIRVPTKSRKTLEPGRVQTIAESMLDIGQQTPISIRLDGDRLVLVEGLHRLEACKALGETTIIGVVVSAELAQHRMPLRESPEAAAEHDKMARLKKLRLEKEAAEKSTATLSGEMETKAQLPRTHSPKGMRDNPKASSGRAQASAPKTLSEWIAQQKRDGGRH